MTMDTTAITRSDGGRTAVVLVRDSIWQACRMDARLNALGYTAVRYLDRASALAAVCNASPDLLIADDGAYDTNGVHLFQPLIDDPKLRRLPMVLFMDFRTYPDWIHAAFAKYQGTLILGIVTYPFNPGELDMIVQKIDAHRDDERQPDATSNIGEDDL